MPERCYLLTGASGFLGREILREIARREPDARVYALLRAPVGDLERRAAALGWRRVAPRAVAVSGDLMRLRAGLSPRDVERITSEVTHVVHAGATVRFDEDLHRARQVNVHGTRQLLDLARRMKRLERFVLVSTAFVGGERARTLLEGPAPPGRFRNTYERTKWEAEEVARRAMATLPVTIVRPSIIGPALAPPAAHPAAQRASDAPADEEPRASFGPADGVRCSTGAPARGLADEPRARFLMLLHLYLTHGWRWVPGTPSSIVDLVPVDLVARATLALAERPLSDGRWYHLAAGPRASTLGELGEIASRTFRAPPLAFVPRPLFRAALRLVVWGRARVLLDRAMPYVPYLSVRTRIDTTDSQRVLRELGIEMPRVADAFAELLKMLHARGELDVAAAHAPAPMVSDPPASAASASVRTGSALARPPVRFGTRQVLTLSAGRDGAAPPRRALERRS